MEIRVLEYFIAIAEYKSITSAANAIHISQSTLSRQIMDLEEKLGVTLFERGKREITLTEDGEFLLQRAREIVDLAFDTEEKIHAGQSLSGNIRIGIGEASVNELILNSMKHIINNSPNIILDYRTLDADKIFQAIDKDLLDFGIIWTNDNISKYEFIDLPYENHWGAVINKNDSLCNKEELVAADLRHRNLILPQQLDVMSDLKKYLNQYAAAVRVTGYYDMNYNMLAMVKSEIGIALTLDKEEYKNMDNFLFKPIKNLKPIKVKLIWKANNKLTRLNKAFLDEIKKSF